MTLRINQHVDMYARMHGASEWRMDEGNDRDVVTCTLYVYVGPTPLSLREFRSQVCVSNCNNVCGSSQGMLTCTWTLLDLTSMEVKNCVSLLYIYI